MGWMRRGLALTAAAMLASLAAAGPSLARSQSTGAPDATEMELATILADPEQAARFLAEPDWLDRLAALQPSASSGAFETLRAALRDLLVLDEIRPRAQLALGMLNHHLGFTGAAEGYLLAALADGALPPQFRERANELLDLGRRGSRSSVLSGSLTAGLHRGGAVSTGALAQSPEEVTRQSNVQDFFVQVDVGHRFGTGLSGVEWQSALHAQTTRVFDADRVEDAWVALSSGPRVALDRLGLTGGVQLVGGVDFGAADERLDWIAPGGSLLVNWESLGGSFAVAFDWRERRFRDSASSPDNSPRSGRELAGRLAYDFRVSDWLAASASVRYADYLARSAEESYGEMQINFSLRSDLNPFIDRESRLLASSEWQLGSPHAGDAAAGAQTWSESGRPSGQGGGVILSQSVALLVEGGWTRRDALFPHLEYQSWFGKTGIAWQF